MYHARLIVALGFIVMGIWSRFIPHPPNVTALNAIALFSAVQIGTLGHPLAVLFITLLLSDLFLGFHATMPFVYLSFVLTAAMGYWARRKRQSRWFPVCVAVSSILFFVFSNFGVWMLEGTYPHTFQGLLLCYTAALPFLLNQLLGDGLYGIFIFGTFALIEKITSRIESLDRNDPVC